MNVWVIYDHYALKADKIFATEDAAIRFVMDRDDYLLKSSEWSEDRLRKYAENEIEQHEVTDDY